MVERPGGHPGGGDSNVTQPRRANWREVLDHSRGFELWPSDPPPVVAKYAIS